MLFSRRIDALHLNLFHLPLRQGYKLPILLFKASLHIMQGAKVYLNVKEDECCWGMVKLGYQNSKNVIPSVGIQIDLRSGNLIFTGSGIIGRGSNIITRKGGNINLRKYFHNIWKSFLMFLSYNKNWE